MCIAAALLWCQGSSSKDLRPAREHGRCRRCCWRPLPHTPASMSGPECCARGAASSLLAGLCCQRLIPRSRWDPRLDTAAWQPSVTPGLPHTTCTMCPGLIAALQIPVLCIGCAILVPAVREGVPWQAMQVYLTKTIKGLRDAVDKALLPPKAAKKGKAPAHVPQEVHQLCCTSCAAQMLAGSICHL